ncbi:Stomatin-like protein 2 [Hordeum vulgare]|nr:Stomatin-like protein 2 [Hordeum vulgare]
MSRYIADPFLASYVVEDPIYAVTQLAQTTARNELVKITLEKTFKERDALNHNIMALLKKAMERLFEAERRKRAQIIDSECAMMETENKAKGEAEAILAMFEATARGVAMAPESFKTQASIEMKTMLFPSDPGNQGAMTAQAQSAHLSEELDEMCGGQSDDKHPAAPQAKVAGNLDPDIC